MRIHVYIDGFNFYYRRARGTPYKWLDFGAICNRLFPNDEIKQIRYFTSLVKSDASDKDKRTRQKTYIRALETIPNLEVHYGKFTIRSVQRRLANQQTQAQNDKCNDCGFSKICCLPNSLLESFKVEDPKEKESDVNLVSYLLWEGSSGEYDKAVVITSDSDFVTPIRIVKEEMNLHVHVINPSNLPSSSLHTVASSYYILRKSDIKTCQFPNTLVDGDGSFSKPSSW